jgi:ketosteroid isomerase-like protein
MIENVIDTFSRGLAARDGDAMVSCCHDDVVFEDPAFGELRADDARAMWRMLCSSATDLRVRHTVVDVAEMTATVNWIADYTLTTTGRTVTNDVTAHLRFADGKIIDHRDHFDFWKWSSQALGLPGKLLGWSPMLKSKVRSTTRSNLDAFRARAE